MWNVFLFSFISKKNLLWNLVMRIYIFLWVNNISCQFSITSPVCRAKRCAMIKQSLTTAFIILKSTYIKCKNPTRRVKSKHISAPKPSSILFRSMWEVFKKKSCCMVASTDRMGLVLLEKKWKLLYPSNGIIINQVVVLTVIWKVPKFFYLVLWPHTWHMP